MNDNQTFSVSDNDLELEAWNEWKDICSIKGCSADNSLLLATAVTRRFLKKVNYVEPGYRLFVDKTDENDEPRPKADSQKKDSAQPARKALTPIMRLCSEEFDMGIIEKADFPGINKHTGKERKKKKYKDYVWDKIEESNDPPLKVIRGILTGPKGIINDIVENYLVNDRGFIWTNDVNGNRVLTPEPSLQDPIDGKDGTSTEFGETIPDPGISSCDITPSDIEYINSEIPKLFSAKEAAVLLACDAGIALTNASLLCFLEIEKTQAYDMQKKVFKKLQDFINDYFDYELAKIVIPVIINRLFSMLKAEKGASAFLSMLETKTNN